jgi:SAM-dependent methyltransferase
MAGAPRDEPSVPDYDEVWTSVYGDMQESGPVHRHLKRLVARVLDGLEYESVLDVGCGPAHNHALLTGGRPGVSFAGVDVSEVALAEARARVGGTFWHGDIQTWRPPGVWDLVHCSLVMEHLPDDRGALHNLRAVTGRHLLLTTIGGDFERYRPWEERMGHVRNYRRGELETKLDEAGFRVREAIYWGWPLYSPLARRLQNHSATGTGEFGLAARVASAVLYRAFFLNRRDRGDVLVVLAEPSP